MRYVAYRRIPYKGAEDHEMGTFDSVTRLFIMRNRHGKAVNKPQQWHGDSTFEDWVASYRTIWSLDLHDAYWISPYLVLDEGL